MYEKTKEKRVITHIIRFVNDWLWDKVGIERSVLRTTYEAEKELRDSG